jgi:hypothetical protein
MVVLLLVWWLVGEIRVRDVRFDDAQRVGAGALGGELGDAGRRRVEGDEADLVVSDVHRSQSGYRGSRKGWNSSRRSTWGAVGDGPTPKLTTVSTKRSRHRTSETRRRDERP